MKVVIVTPGNSKMSITIKHLKTFVAVAQTRSFAEASARVCLSQPAVSISIRNLEEEVGGRLLTRSTRTLALTPEGEEFLPVALRLLSDWEEALGDLHNRFSLKRGKLAVAAMPSFASTELPGVLVPFRQRYPDINITIHDVIAEDVIEMVRNGRVEVGVTFEPGDSEDLDFQTLFTDRFVVAVPTSHPFASKRKIMLRALVNQPFITLQRPSSIRGLIDSTLDQEGITLSVQLETNQLATIGRMVAMGLGISIVPALCIGQMAEMGVVCKPLVTPDIVRRVGVVTRRRYPLSQSAAAFLANLEARFAG